MRKVEPNIANSKAHSNEQLPLDDETLRDVLGYVQRDGDGYLPWDIPDPTIPELLECQFAKRLSRLGIKTRPTQQCSEGYRDGHWLWTGPLASSGTRPGYKKLGQRFYPYRALVATFIDKPLSPAGAEDEGHHACGSTLCVRPGSHHVMPVSKETHEALTGLDSARRRGATPDGLRGFRDITPKDKKASDE